MTLSVSLGSFHNGMISIKYETNVNSCYQVSQFLQIIKAACVIQQHTVKLSAVKINAKFLHKHTKPT